MEIELNAVAGAEDQARLRPVAEQAGHHQRLACAGLQHRGSGSLKGDLQVGFQFKHFVGSKQKSRFTHVDGLARLPFNVSETGLLFTSNEMLELEAHLEITFQTS